jgi:hypothetical protein
MVDTDEAMRTITERLPLVIASAKRTLELVGTPERLPRSTTRWALASRSIALDVGRPMIEGMATLRLDVLSPGLGAAIVIDLVPDGSTLTCTDDPALVVERILAAATAALADPNQNDFDDDAHRAALRAAGELVVPDDHWHVVEGTPLHGPGFCRSSESDARVDLPSTGRPMLVVGPGARLPIDDVPLDQRCRRIPHVLMRVARRQRGVDLSDLDPITALRLLADDDDRKAA